MEANVCFIRRLIPFCVKGTFKGLKYIKERDFIYYSKVLKYIKERDFISYIRIKFYYKIFIIKSDYH